MIIIIYIWTIISNRIRQREGSALETVVEREFRIFEQRETQTNTDNTKEAQLTSDRDSHAGRSLMLTILDTDRQTRTTLTDIEREAQLTSQRQTYNEPVVCYTQNWKDKYREDSTESRERESERRNISFIKFVV